MRSETEQMERDILRVYRCARGQERPDIAEFMLAALEKLDRERERFPVTERPLMEAYRDIASRPGEPRCAAQRLSTSKSEPHS